MTRRRFTKEFDADAVALVLDGGLAPTQAARHLGIGGRTWKTGFARLSSTGAKHPQLTTAEWAELAAANRCQSRWVMILGLAYSTSPGQTVVDSRVLS